MHLLALTRVPQARPSTTGLMKSIILETLYVVIVLGYGKITFFAEALVNEPRISQCGGGVFGFQQGSHSVIPIGD